MKTIKEVITIEVTAEISYTTDKGREYAIESALGLNPSSMGFAIDSGGSYGHEIKTRKLADKI